jgi:hypothetical protein
MATIKLSGVNVGGVGGGGGGATALSQLTDVGLEDPSEGQVLTWNNSQNHWENRNIPPVNQISNSDEFNTYSTAVTNTGIVTMTTARGGIEFGAQPEIGAPSHFHIMRAPDQSYDLIFGDDYNYLNLLTFGGVKIGSYRDSEPYPREWLFYSDGSQYLPAIEVSPGLSEQSTIKSQRHIIGSQHWSAIISGTTPTVVYTASSVQIATFKNTVNVQHSSGGFEIFDVTASRAGTDVYHTVSNRVAPPSLTATTVLVDVDANGILQITLTLTSGASDAWVTYSATEFGTPND